jgi:bacillolysin
MKNIKYKIFILISIVTSSINYAQNTEVTFENIFMNSETIHEKLGDNSLNNFNQSVHTLLDLDNNYSYETIANSELNETMGYSHSKIQEFYKGLKIEYSTLNIHVRNEEVIAVNGEYANFLTLNTEPSISVSAALKLVLNHIRADKYIWQDEKEYKFLLANEEREYTSLPNGELVICRNFNNLTTTDFRLAYKFDIYALKPLSRDYVYIDANTGEIIHSNAIIKTCNANLPNHSITKSDTFAIDTPNIAFILGSAQTRYSTTRNIETTNSGGGYQLNDSTRGLGVETYNLNTGTSYSGATNITDNDNNWTAAEWHNATKDDAALDAHWGAESTYDYFLTKHARNSYNNSGAKIKSYVHYSTNYFNAFWNGNVMTYGDGNSTNFNNPLTTLDICGHEIGHAICTHTANLVYANEPGALNESYSDIWGACVENFADSSKQTWVIGEDMQYPIRSLANPNLYNQPDTYHGTNWYYGSADNGGVHTNSGVQNYWFYLLAMGGSGTNDIGTNYNVIGIGIENAAKIAYRTESVYLTSSSDYTITRNLSIQAANDLFGVNSPEAISVENAWCAVGLGSCIPNISCLPNLTITTNVTSGSDTKQASLSINALNTINSGATGIYHAGEEVLLSNGFTSNNSSIFRAYIEGCSNNYVAKQSQGNDITKNESTYESKKITLFDQGLIISPNPTSGKIIVKHESDIQQLKLYNSFGQLLKEYNPNSEKNTEIDLTYYPSGLYILSDGKKQQKVIKQ